MVPSQVNSICFLRIHSILADIFCSFDKGWIQEDISEFLFSNERWRLCQREFTYDTVYCVIIVVY
jgi:hypothetical protein